MPHFLKINQFCFAYSFYWIPIDPGHRFRFVLKKWPPSSGLGGRHASESLAILFRIPWLPCPGLCSISQVFFWRDEWSIIFINFHIYSSYHHDLILANCILLMVYFQPSHIIAAWPFIMSSDQFKFVNFAYFYNTSLCYFVK